MSAPIVSIVTPSLNQVRFLEQTLRSVLEQDYPHIEYIVIDGGSTDGSVEVIERYASRLAYWVSEPDHGQSDAINKGFARSSGTVMAWLNSDDLYAEGAISSAVSVLERHPVAALVYGDCDAIDEENRFVRRLPTRPFDLADTLRGVPSIPQPAAFWRRAAWERVGPLRKDYHYCMDLELWLSIAELFDVRYVPQRWAYFREYTGTKSSRGPEAFVPEQRLINQAHQRRRHLLRRAFARPRAYAAPRVLLFLAARLMPRRLMEAVNQARGYRQV